MQLRRLGVCFLALVTRICSAGLIADPSEVDSSLVEAAIDILESCYKDRFGTVGVAGHSIGSIIEVISSGDIVIPITSIEETSSAVNHYPVDSASRHKLHVFVVTATDPSSLVRTLTQVKNSKWWNHMASFILIDGSEVQDGCSNAYEMLWQAWKMNLLNSKLLCFHPTRGRLIYTFNPYTSDAPVPWLRENTYRGINGHAWTLFVQGYRQNKSRCDTLDFDKTLDLGGYEIHVTVAGMKNCWYPDPSIKQSVGDQVKCKTARIFFTLLNATVNILLHPPTVGPPRDENGNPNGWAAEVVNGSSDMSLNAMVLRDWGKYESTYPYFHSILIVMTQYPGYKSQLDKLISVLDRSSRVGVSLVLLVTLLFFICYLRQSPVPAILNIVLIICNAALSKIPTQLAPRIYLGCLFMLVVTIHGIYQGKFASLLTKQVRLPTVNSIDDLARSDHTLYGLEYYTSFVNQSTFEGRYVRITEYKCTDYVLRDPKAACIGGQLRLISEAVKSKLHLSHESMGTMYLVYLVRPDWPLIDRINVIYGRVTAAYILEHLRDRELQSVIRKIESYENQDHEKAFKPLTLAQLSFAFVILAIGLVCATISFIAEVSIYRGPVADLRNRIRRRRAWTA